MVQTHPSLLLPALCRPWQHTRTHMHTHKQLVVCQHHMGTTAQMAQRCVAILIIITIIMIIKLLKLNIWIIKHESERPQV